MRRSRSVTVKVTGLISVSVSPSTSRGYVGTPITFTVDWSPVSGFECIIDIDYGDGKHESTSAFYPPVSFKHTYGSPGSYRVKVTVYDTGYASEGSGETSVEVRSPLTVSLDASPKSGNVPLTVTFTCEAHGGYLNYTWTLDFGDGSSPESGTRSSEGSWTVKHTYNKAGTYTATLTVTDALGASLSIPVTFKIIEGIKEAWRKLPVWQKILLVGAAVAAAGSAFYLVRKG